MLCNLALQIVSVLFGIHCANDTYKPGAGIIGKLGPEEKPNSARGAKAQGEKWTLISQ